MCIIFVPSNLESVELKDLLLELSEGAGWIVEEVVGVEGDDFGEVLGGILEKEIRLHFFLCSSY